MCNVVIHKHADKYHFFVFKMIKVGVFFYVCFTGSGVAMSQLSDAESIRDGHDHTPLQKSAADTLSFSRSKTRTSILRSFDSACTPNTDPVSATASHSGSSHTHPCQKGWTRRPRSTTSEASSRSGPSSWHGQGTVPAWPVSQFSCPPTPKPTPGPDAQCRELPFPTAPSSRADFWKIVRLWRFSSQPSEYSHIWDDSTPTTALKADPQTRSNFRSGTRGSQTLRTSACTARTPSPSSATTAALCTGLLESQSLLPPVQDWPEHR